MRLWTAILLVLTLALLIYAVNHDGVPLPSRKTVSSAEITGTENKEVTWAVLRGLDKDTGKASDDVRALDGKEVRVPGYIVPLDDDSRGLTEFLLVPYGGACIHTPPPPPNQMVYVKMLRGEKADFGLMDGVWLSGKIFIGRRSSPYGPTFYSMTGISVEPYR